MLSEAWKKARRIFSLNLFEIGRTKQAALGQSGYVVRNGAVWKVAAEADLGIGDQAGERTQSVRIGGLSRIEMQTPQFVQYTVRDLLRALRRFRLHIGLE